MTDRNTYDLAALDHRESATWIESPVLLAGDDQLLQGRLMQLAGATDPLITSLNWHPVCVDSQSRGCKEKVDTRLVGPIL
ncbi:hypothetical protein Mal15_41680 [Stieleria maiorica]|uniref:Uncharacterized protein n=1 Tax=Stieleria maiorica TaxID=2795974 RepID=A0A5B9MG08_9BACT|nr:hypothetical protein Mal15_41680 [Stieleria maiorica]